MFAKLFEIKGRQLLLTRYGEVSPFKGDPDSPPERTIHIQCDVSDTVNIYAQIIAPTVKEAQKLYDNMTEEQAEEIINTFSKMHEKGESHTTQVNPFTKPKDNTIIH